MLTNHEFFLTAPPPPQMRQHAPNNHILDLVVVCMLSPLRMSLLCAALSLLSCVWPCIHLGLLYTTQTRATPGTVISRAHSTPQTSHHPHHPPCISHPSPGPVLDQRTDQPTHWEENPVESGCGCDRLEVCWEVQMQCMCAHGYPTCACVRGWEAQGRIGVRASVHLVHDPRANVSLLTL